ncbi:unnamed protein product, partial [Diamesa tonsa]
MLAMRRESDNNISGSNNSTTHSNYTATNIVPGDNNLTHLNYHHPVHGYSSATASYSGYQSNNNRPALSAQNNLDEYVDILQVQQILENRIQLENTTASASTTSTVPTASYTTSVISPSTATTSSASSSSAAAVTKNRPRVNLQKAAEYSAQVQGDSPSRRVLFDYPGSPYLYGNYHHHPSPSDDLVALWFGGNNSGELTILVIY